MLALALLPRLWQIDLTRFFNDQLELLQSAGGWIDTGRLPLTSGFTFAVTGAHHPPLVTYLLALPMLISRSPVWLSAWSAGLDALAAPVVYFIAKRISGSTLAGVSAGVLYALNPAAITFGRMIWNPDFATLFAALALFGLVDFAVRGRALSLALSLFALSWQIQVHVVNLVLAPLWPIVAAAGRAKLRLKPILLAAFLSLIPLAPYVYLQTQTGWGDIGKLLSYSRLPKVTDLSALDTAAHLVGPATFGALNPGPGEAPRPFEYDALTWLLIGLLLAGLAFTWRRPAWPRTIVALWLWVPILAAISHSSDPLSPSDGVAPHYLLAILPAAAVLQGLALHELWQFVRLERPGWPLARNLGLAASLVGLAVPLAAGYVSFQRTVASDTRQSTFGMPLRYSLAAAKLVSSSTANQPLYLAVPFLYNRTVPTLAGRAEYRWFLDQSVFVFPNTGAWYLAQNDTFGYRFLSQHFGPPVADVPNQAGVPEFRLFRLPDNASDRVFGGPSFMPLDVDLGGAIQLQGYVAEPLAAGQPSRVSLLWRILDPGKIPNHLSHFAHLVDASGTTVSTTPDLWDVSEPWRVGDLVASSFDLNVKPATPTGGYWLELGFYHTFSQQRLGTAIRVGPLRVQGSSQAAVPAAPLATFGNDEVALLRADWQGQDVAVDWEALAPPKASYTVFVQAIDPAGKLVAQWDGQPGGGSFPTALWQSGDVIHDVYPLGRAPSSGLRLEIGMYTQPDVKRLAEQSPRQPGVADHFTLDTASAP